MPRPVSEVADMETQLGPAGRYVDPVFQHSRRHYVGFISDLMKAASVGFVKWPWNTLVFSSLPRKVGL